MNILTSIGSVIHNCLFGHPIVLGWIHLLRHSPHMLEQTILTDICWKKCWNRQGSLVVVKHLPLSTGFDFVVLVVDRVSKMAHFVLTRDTVMA